MYVRNFEHYKKESYQLAQYVLLVYTYILTSFCVPADTLSTADVEARNQRREARRVKTRRKLPNRSPSRYVKSTLAPAL